MHPLVIGKSGSLLVNQSGSDFSLSLNMDDGPARRFLHTTGFQWCKTHIALPKTNDEENALQLEQTYRKKFNLFSS